MFRRALRLRTLVQIDSCLSLVKTVVSEAESSREMGEFGGGSGSMVGVVWGKYSPRRGLRGPATEGGSP